MSTRPLVSVVIPTRNRAALLGRALDSVFAQEALGEKFDLDVTVVDDASTDTTQAVVATYANVRYIRCGEPRGPAGARNSGIEQSRGTYVAFLDDDDAWLPHKLRIQLPRLEGDSAVVYGQILQIAPDGRRIETFPDVRRALSGRIFERLLMDPGIVHVNSMVCHRSSFDAVGLFNTALVCCEDSEMCLRLAFRFPFHFVPVPVAKRYLTETGLYLRHVHSGIAERDARRMLDGVLVMLPSTAAADGLRNEARARLEVELANEAGRVGHVDRARASLRTGLHQAPGVIRDPRIRRIIANVAGHVARDAVRPITAIAALAFEARRLTAGVAPRRASRELLAAIWARVAVTLAYRGTQRGAAGFAAALAIRFGPSNVLKKRFLRLLGGALLRAPSELIRVSRDYSAGKAGDGVPDSVTSSPL